MLQKPRFRPHFRVEIPDDETVYLLSEDSRFALRGRPYVLLAPWLNGNHTLSDILQGLSGHLPSVKTQFLLLSLESKGYLCEADTHLSATDSAFWSALNVVPPNSHALSQQQAIHVISFGIVPSEWLVTALESLSLQCSNTGNLTVVLVDDYLDQGLAEWNRRSVEQQHPWLLVKPTGKTLWLGPLFEPGKSGCWDCLAHRLRENQEVETYLSAYHPGKSPNPHPIASTSASVQIALHLVALEVAKYLARAHSPLEGQIMTMDLDTLDRQTHFLTQRPQCPTCGEPTIYPPKPIQLAALPRLATEDAGYRTVPPSETLRRYERHVSPLSGIVSTIRQISDPNDPDIYVYDAFHRFYPTATSLANLRANTIPHSFGKGKTPAQSKTSALCEALERYSGRWTGREHRVWGSYHRLGETAIHPNTCLLYSEAQYHHRQEWNQSSDAYNWVGEPFDPDFETDWVAAWSLTEQTFKYLPAAFCYYNYPLPNSHFFCKADSNGNAAGNTIEEAILQGFLELVERDSVAIWWYNRIPRPAIAWDSLQDPYFDRIRDRLRQWQREMWLLDLTCDFGIPVIASVSYRPGKRSEALILGLGAHFDPQIAAIRAVTEMNQLLACAGILGDHDPPPLGHSALHQWLTEGTLTEQPHLSPDPNQAPRRLDDFPVYPQQDLGQDVLDCAQMVRDRGMDLLVLDQTQPDIGLPVVKVVVPGLRLFWARFAPGRLYDLPVQMGWRSTPLAESELNPMPFLW